MGRRRARELAFRALFGAARGDEPLLDAWADLRADLTETPDEAEEVYGEPLGADGLAFAERLVRTFAEHQSELDGRLAEVLEGWTFAQMSQTDLAVLRLALTELTYEDLPPEVTFEVAVRIAKRYGGAESGRFVNGVLARLYRDRQGSDRQQSGSRTRDATQTLEVQAEKDSTAEDATAVNSGVQCEDVPASVSDVQNIPDAAQPDLETPKDPDVKNPDVKNPDVQPEPQPDPRDPDVVKG